jgi:hypothetical protein
MGQSKDKTESELCECESCCKQIPLSAAKTAEGADYVYYFCGTDCYEKWLEKQKQEK